MQLNHIRRISFLLFFTLFTSGIFLTAQSPEEILLDGSAEQSSTRAACADQFAGTVSLGNFNGQSNDINLNRMFLCYNDQIEIIHNGDADLTGDPDPTTPAGIGYAWYFCPPTISGPDLGSILTDNCLLANPPPANGIYIYVDQITGDAIFQNRANIGGQTIPEYFNGGNPAEYIFTPITFDEMVAGQAEYEGSPPGPCVNSNTAAAFSVVYLNPIQQSATNVSTQGGECQGSFVIKGGLPEFDGSTYTLNIEKTDDPTMVGTPLQPSYTHGETVRFTVPEPGAYTITVEDGKSCGTIFQMELNCDGVIFNIEDLTVNQGDAFCIDFTLENFEEMLSFSFAVNWDPTIIEYTGYTNFNIPMGPVTFINDFNADQGFITMIWDADDFVNGNTLPDGTLLFSLCFNAIGDPGDVSPVSISSMGTTLFLAADINGQVPTSANNGSVTIEFPTTLGVNSSSCGSSGNNDGSFTIQPFGGEAPYQIDWQNLAGTIMGSGMVAVEGGTITFDNLPDDTYDVTILDNTGTPLFHIVVVSDGGRPSATFDIIDPSCHDISNGSIEAMVIADTPYITRWSNGVFGSEIISSLSTGIYQATIEDNGGCQNVYTLELEAPELMVESIVEDASCETVSDGRIIVAASGGNPINGDEYGYRWNDQNLVITDTSRRNNLLSGLYIVTVTDANNCAVVDSFTIEAPSRVFISEIEITPIQCHNDSGQIKITASTTNAPNNHAYAFDWSPNTQDVTIGRNMNRTSLIPAGSYSVTVVDVNISLQCRFDTVITLDNPLPLSVQVVDVVDESCTVGMDGSITVMGLGGTVNSALDYEYSWDNMDTGATITGLTGGRYHVTVSDLNNCTDTISAFVGTPMGVEILGFDSVSVSCPGTTDGSLTVRYNAGNATVTAINWEDQNSNQYFGETIDNLASGLYEVTIITDNGCSSSAQVRLGQPVGLRLDSLTIIDPSCPGEPTAEIRVFVSGGNGNYQYIWSVPGGGPNAAVLPALTAGTYGVTVSEAGSNCDSLIVDDILIVDPPPITATFENILGTTCHDACDGEALVIPAGGSAGTGNYFIEWQSGETLPQADDLCPGENWVIVTDFICGDSFFVDIPFPDSLEMRIVDVQEPSCFGSDDGSLTITGFGGTPPYRYQWFGGPADSTYSGLSAGNYMIRVRDANGCTVFDDIDLGQPDSLVAYVDTARTRDVSCPGENNGSITIAREGGNSGMTNYIWAGGISNTETAEPLSVGTYFVTVTDENGCSDTTSYRVTEPEPISATLTNSSMVPCFGETLPFTVASASGGTNGPYRYSVNNGVLIALGDTSDLPAGTYLIGVFDGNGCQFDTTIIITQPNPIVLELGQDIEVQLGDSVLLAPEVLTSPVPIQTYLWQATADILSCPDCPETWARPFSEEVVSLTVINENGCEGFDDVIVRAITNRQIYIPTAFSPNNDGINDFFTVYAGQEVAGLGYVRIFNRWGDKVFEREQISANFDEAVAWDGRIKGKVPDPGVFVYLIEVVFLDGEKIVYKGTLNLML